MAAEKPEETQQGEQTTVEEAKPMEVEETAGEDSAAGDDGQADAEGGVDGEGEAAGGDEVEAAGGDEHGDAELFAEAGGEDQPMEDAGPADATEPEAAKESEADAPDDDRERLAAGAVKWNLADSTLNVMPTANGKLLMSLSDGGFQYLLAGIRANVGVKAGRYMFEVKIVETLNPAEPQGGRGPSPKQVLRVGLSLGGSSLFLAETPDSVCFDSEGGFFHGKKRSKASMKFGQGNVIALLVNLDPTSPNANTVSLFKDGVRVSDPQEIPEGLRGKALYPTVSYRNVTLHAHFGPVPRAALPFKCRTLAGAAKADVALAAPPAEPAEGRYEVMFPVGMPEQGYFDWVDQFLEKNPTYTELSDRKILEWATKSGLWRPKARDGHIGSADKPDMKFGIPLMDDLSIIRIMDAIAPTLRRNYIVPELRLNLLSQERKEALSRFSSSEFRRTATVIMGEPTQEYKDKVHELLLADKVSKAEAEKAKKAQEEERKRLLAEKRKKAEEARRARTGEAKDDEEKKDEDTKEGEEGAAAKEDTEDAEMKAAEETPTELTEEEKKLWYRKSEVPDLSEKAIVKSYAHFTLPSKDEGFDTVTYAWQTEESCTTLLKDYVLNMKLNTPAEELQPGKEFKEQWSAWQKLLQEWKRLHSDWKDPAKKKAIQQKKITKGEDGEEVKPPEVNVEDLDVMAVEDVKDIGTGEPLFAEFVYEDWALLSVRFEIHLLLHSFKRDLADPDRPGFGEAHLPFYFDKYFKKSFSLSNFSCQNMEEFLEHMPETFNIGDKGFLTALLDEDTTFEQHLKLAEEYRRERMRRVDAGDETAQLKFVRPPPPQASADRGSARSDNYTAGSRSGDRRGQTSSDPRKTSTTPPQSSSRYGSSSYGSGAARSGSGADSRGSTRYNSSATSRTGGGSSYTGGSGASSRGSNGSSRTSYYGTGSTSGSGSGSGSGTRSSRTTPPPAPPAKRPYPPAGSSSSYPASQRPRTSSSSYGGSGSGGYSSGYSRR